MGLMGSSTMAEQGEGIAYREWLIDSRVETLAETRKEKPGSSRGEREEEEGEASILPTRIIEAFFFASERRRSGVPTLSTLDISPRTARVGGDGCVR
jgi:hypothetical protein